MRATFRKYFAVLQNSKFVLLLNIIDKAFSFIIFLLLARKFHPEIYGQVITLFTVSVVFITIFDFGLPIYLQREISINRISPNEIFSKIFTINLLFFTAYIVLSFSYYKIFYSEIPVILFLLIAPLQYVSSLVNLCNKTLSGLSDFRNQYSAFVVPRILILAAFLIGLNFLSLDLTTLMIIMLAGSVLNLALVFYFINKSHVTFSIKHFSIKDISALLKVSLPIGLAVILNFLYDKIDVLLISVFKDFQSVAYYNIGYGLFKASTISFSFLLVSGFTFVASISKNKEEVGLFFKDHAKLIGSICIAISLLVFFLAEYIIKFLYTDKFLNSVIVLKILSFGIIAVGLNNLTGTIINGMGYFKIVMYITLYAFIFNIALNIFLLPPYGIIGASVISVATEYLIFFTEYFYLRKILKS